METKELIEELIKHKGETPIAWGLDGSHYKLPDTVIDNIIETLKAYEELVKKERRKIEKIYAVENCPKPGTEEFDGSEVFDHLKKRVA